jgi:regulator of nucleoside diphosphate kinase
MQQNALINSLDRERLLGDIDFSGTPPDHLSKLRTRLLASRPVPPREVPANLITMNSIIQIEDLDLGETETFALVYPSYADDMEGILRIGTHLGSAIFSRWVGEEIFFQGRRRQHRVRISALEYQPEAAGAFAR